jgi:hypothetical protein
VKSLTSYKDELGTEVAEVLKLNEDDQSALAGDCKIASKCKIGIEKVLASTADLNEYIRSFDTGFGSGMQKLGDAPPCRLYASLKSADALRGQLVGFEEAFSHTCTL